MNPMMVGSKRGFAFRMCILAIGGMCTMGGSALAQKDDGYKLIRGTIGGGGGTSSGGAFTLTGTIGQPNTGVSSGGEYVNSAGFWPGSIGCVVNLTDLMILAEVWLSSGNTPADLDSNGKVNMDDFFVLSKWWLDHCPSDWPLK